MSISIGSAQLSGCDIFITAADAWDAYYALLAWAREDLGDPYKRMLLDASDLVEALHIGWEAVIDEAGNIIDIRNGTRGISPLRLDVMLDLFVPLAPFVTGGALLVITHDDSNAGLYDVEFRFDGTQVQRDMRRII